jgi:hypothetical protein
MSLGHPLGLRLQHDGFPGCPDYVPWDRLTTEHRQRAEWNHCGQTVERLNERGGVSPLEFRTIAMNKNWHDVYGYGSRGNGIGLPQYYEAANFIREFLNLPPLPGIEDALIQAWGKRKRL